MFDDDFKILYKNEDFKTKSSRKFQNEQIKIELRLPFLGKSAALLYFFLFQLTRNELNYHI